MSAAAARPGAIDPAVQSKLAGFTLARLCLMTAILFTTIFLRQDRGPGDVDLQLGVLSDDTILRIYGVLAVSFLFSLINVSLWEETLQVRFYMPSQLVYDLLLTSYLVYLTGVNESIFLFLYLLNIVFASVVYRLHGALLVAGLSGAVYAFIYYANASDTAAAFYSLAYNELLFLLTALLSGQLMDELRRQKMMLDSQRQSIATLELLNNRLLNSIPVGIVTVDQDQYVQNVNQTALHLLGLSRPPEMRLKYHELLPGLRGVIDAWPRMTDSQRLRFLFSHGVVATPRFSLSVVPLKDPEEGARPGGPSNILVFEDISKLLELERKLEIESRLAATGELAAGIAHEIRNPLASISGSIEMLSRNLGSSDEQSHKLFGIALRETARLNHLITDFLEFAKPREETPEDFPLYEAVSEVAEAVRNAPRASGTPGGVADGGVGFALEIPRAVAVHVNRERMKQVLFNLFLNAVEAASGRPVSVAVRAADQGGQVAIDVIDDGPGVPSELSARIFDPFFTTKADGTGLGLATVARILKAAKGSINVEPSARGAHFRLLVPSAAGASIGSEAAC